MTLFKVALRRSSGWAFFALSTLFSTVSIGVGTDWLDLRQSVIVGAAGIGAGFLTRFFLVLGEGLVRGEDVVVKPHEAAAAVRVEQKAAIESLEVVDPIVTKPPKKTRRARR